MPYSPPHQPLASCLPGTVPPSAHSGEGPRQGLTSRDHPVHQAGVSGLCPPA